MEINGLSEQFTFKKALPVWEEGTENEMNRSLLFRTVCAGKAPVRLSIAAHTRYQIFINGVFYAAGPARAAHGHYRVSVYDMEKELNDGDNIIGVIAAGYNANSYYLLDGAPFICAEAERNGEITAATGSDREFESAVYFHREQKVPRYSFQRPFTESYYFDTVFDLFFTAAEVKFRPLELSEVKAGKFITRSTPYCEYGCTEAAAAVASGILTKSSAPRTFKDRSMTEISEKLKGFKENELTSCAVNELYAYDRKVIDGDRKPGYFPELAHGSFIMYDMGKNLTGYIALSVQAIDDVEFYAVFNEVRDRENEALDPGRMGCENVIKWQLEGGRTYELISFEPYTYRYIDLSAIGGRVKINAVKNYAETYPSKGLINLIKMPDEELQEIYDAAVETFVQNATDIFMDCPSRERAGWLCDSYFTARVEKELTGRSLVEHDFLENFILPDSFRALPEGMLPMCYPADHYNGCFIPNWAMWYVIELKEYRERSGDTSLAAAAEKRVRKLLDYFAGFENADGLLEKLESWIFVEWSAANGFVQDINYPTNMLYALMLDSAAELYGDPALSEKAAKLRKTVAAASFDGEYFCDNAIIDDGGKAVRTENHTETCQYYAFFTNTATKDSYPELYDRMINEFGPGRDSDTEHKDVPVSNAFIGNYLRLQILFRDKMYDKVVKEIRDFFLPMARRTGTLWENMTDGASCDHGFASHVAYWLNKIYG